MSFGDLWEEMLTSGLPFALLDASTHVFADANEEYAALLEIGREELKGQSVLSFYSPEIARSIEAINEAFTRGMLDSVRSQGDLHRLDGRIISLKGWTRRVDEPSGRKLLVTSAVESDSDVTPDDRIWVARAPHLFGPPSDWSSASPTGSEERAEQLEQHLRRIGLEVQAAGLLALPLGGEMHPDLIRELNGLSARQREIVVRLLAGERVTEIAHSIYLSPSTVRNHLTTVFRRFGVHSQMELLLMLKDPSRSLGDR